jgi:peptidase S41-like protein
MHPHMAIPALGALVSRYIVRLPVATCVALFVLPGLALADGSTPPIPDTPAGHALVAWLDAFNSDDSGTFASFAKMHAPWMGLDQEKALRASTGGYDLTSIDGSDSLWIVFHATARVSGTRIVGSLVVRRKELEHITLLDLVPAESRSAGVVLDEAGRSRVIESAQRLISRFYVFPDVAKKTVVKLEALRKRDYYRNITDGEVFAVRLEDDLRVISGDEHFAVDYFAQEMPPEEPRSRPHPDPRMLAADNCGFEKADHLRPNIGYLKLNIFAEPDVCASTAIAAMNFLADSGTLIIDLRDNHGGAPPMAALISSYLFDEPTHLDDIYDHTKETTAQSWTFPYMPGKKLTGTAVYVLISSQTFSTGEEFSFDLKNLKRATLVGDATGGGAHPVAPHRIDGHFFIRVPFGRFMNPITKADWEGTGVEPDIKVPAADALDEALKRARQEP